MLILNEKVQRAINFANIKHNSQLRKGTENLYSVHPISVGVLLLNSTKEIDTICAGILHDTLEDTETTEQEIEEEFGKDVLKYVKEASETDKSLSWEERKIATIEKMGSISKQGLLVTLADKTHNLSSIVDDLNRCDNKSKYWSKFNRGYEQQKWYYFELFKTFNKLCRGIENDFLYDYLEVLLEEYNRLFIKFINISSEV